MSFLDQILVSLESTAWDVLPIILVLSFFQFAVLRKSIPHFRRIFFGLVMTVVGLAIFIIGLNECIFPLGEAMASQLSDPQFLSPEDPVVQAMLENGKRIPPVFYSWTILFAFLIGFSTAMAEPALIAVALKARDITTGAISAWGLRIAVALGSGTGVALGTYRIIVGTPIQYYIILGYILLLTQTYFAPKFIVPLAYDSGGVTTSTVTVPLLVALGLGLAHNVPGSSPLLDGFGLIAMAAMFPMMTVMAYAMIAQVIQKRRLSQPSA
ncbi:DUF1538 domain-containing protein [Nitrospina watsonii]|uniref:Na(+), Li(+), K(+)/H(+) antiporter subunit B n=1 Tax=Nitrospina watsonii TaxID=1323948 RepID=A0ABM9HDM5_9BACT|nr:DUF1538 domain-containing protein [Nitrospina watsonii]CAI2718345.1 Na(+), Li(+), K(+)/H(+) antiporter subunit B [Nitrospina watsonii]